MTLPIERFDLVLLQEVHPGHEPEDVAAALAKRFGKPQQKFLDLLRRSPAVVRRGLDRTAALRFRAILEEAGARTRIVSAKSPEQVEGPAEPDAVAPQAPASATGPEEAPLLPLFFFEPRNAVAFPPRCVCCFREAPNTFLPIDATATTKTVSSSGSIGTGVGFLLGDLPGALVGKVIEDSIREGLEDSQQRGERSGRGLADRYEVPICSKCAGTMKREGDTEFWDQGGDGTGRTSRCLTVDPESGYLAVRFELPAYAEAFAAVNHGLIFTDLAEVEREVARCTPAFDRSPHLETAFARYMRMGGEGRALEERIPTHLRKWLGSKWLAVAPEILPVDLETARRHCGLKAPATILGLISCLPSGSMQQCIAFSSHGVHFANGRDLSPRAGHVTWEALTSPGSRPTPIRMELSPGAIVDVSRSSVAVGRILRTIESIRLSLQEPPLGIPTGPIPLPGASRPSQAPPRPVRAEPASDPAGPSPAGGAQGEESNAEALGPASLDQLRGLLARRTETQRIWIGSDIPPKRLSNASARCNVPPESVLCLVDCTVFGSAKNCLLITENGIHYRNDFKGTVPGGHVSYESLPLRTICLQEPYSIDLDGEDVLEASAAVGTRAAILDLLLDVQGLAREWISTHPI